MTARPNQAGQECEPKRLGAVPTRCPKPLAGSLRAWHRLSGGWSHLLMGKQSGRPPSPPVQTGSTGIAELRRVRPSLSQAQPHRMVSEPGLELALPALCSPGIKQELGTVVVGEDEGDHVPISLSGQGPESPVRPLLKRGMGGGTDVNGSGA